MTKSVLFLKTIQLSLQSGQFFFDHGFSNEYIFVLCLKKHVEINGVFTLGSNNFNFGQETVKKLLQNLVNSSYDLSVFGTQRNWLSVQYESVDMNRVTPQLREVYVKANADIRAIFNNPENAGKDVMWAGLVMDSLLKRDKPESNGVIQ